MHDSSIQFRLSDILYSPIRIKDLETLVENSIRNVLQSLPKEQAWDDKKPFRLKQTAEYLGIAETSVYGLVARGKLKPLKPGKHLLFLKSTLDCYINGQSEQTDPSQYLKQNKKARI